MADCDTKCACEDKGKGTRRILIWGLLIAAVVASLGTLSYLNAVSEERDSGTVRDSKLLRMIHVKKAKAAVAKPAPAPAAPAAPAAQ